jgi:hypothetical protein
MPQNQAAEPADIFEQLLGGGGGWDAQQNYAGQLARRIDSGDHDDIAECARAALCTPAGEKLLAWMIREFLLSATWPGDLMGRDQIATYGPFREGQNSMVVLLHRLVTRADEINLEDAHE